MIAAAWFVAFAAPLSQPAVAPPPRVVLPIVWEWDAGHPKCRAVVTEDGKAVQVLVASGRLTIDPDRGEVDPATLTFRVREESPVVPGAFSVESTRWCPGEVGKGVRVPHSAARVSYPVVVVATQDGKAGGKLHLFRRGGMSVELFAHVRPLSQPELELVSFDPVGYVEP